VLKRTPELTNAPRALTDQRLLLEWAPRSEAVTTRRSMPTIRVATYNICRGGGDRGALREVVRQLAPSILLVNESPKAPVTWRFRCRRLTRDWELSYAGGGRPAGSNMVAVGEGVVVGAVTCLRLPQPLGAPRRGLVSAQLRVGPNPVGVVSTHLSLAAARRIVEASAVLELVRQLRGPVVIAGDLNETPRGPCWRLFEDAGFEDHGSNQWPTFPAIQPQRRIDALLVRGARAVVSHEVLSSPPDAVRRASDHLPVAADIEL
jgi:endonuclease/exonuclease/phosphatase family metal-dependent hydrolase